MSFSTRSDEPEVMGEINMTPLVDVMLVLLVVFIVTIPVIQHAVKVQLPRASSERTPAPPLHSIGLLDACSCSAFNWCRRGPCAHCPKPRVAGPIRPPGVFHRRSVMRACCTASP